jgi:uncharacterized membrane protein
MKPSFYVRVTIWAALLILVWAAIGVYVGSH